MSNFCPVCKSAINDNAVKCNVCSFTDLHREFITKEDAQEWLDTVVLPYRIQWEELKDTFVDGYNAQGYDRDGYDRMGYDKDGYDKDGYDIYDYDKDGYDSKGYDRQGYDKEGYDFFGFDRNGINIDGDDKCGYEKLLGNKGGILLKTDSGTYYGEVENGEPNGYGQMSYDNGNVVTGKWVNGERQGYIKATECNGCTVEILRKDNEIRITLPFIKGGVYRGFFKEDSRGITKFENGATYIGKFEKCKIVYGRWVGKKGALYIGEFGENADRCGNGKLRFEDGTIYIGEFKKNLANGYGKLYYPDGTILEGQWKDNEYIGK